MKNKMLYLIISSKDFIQLQKNVSEAIADGYEPIGALCHFGRDLYETFAQTMMLKKNRSESNKESITINGWDINCIGDALQSQLQKYQGSRQDIYLSTQTTLEKLHRLIKSAENDLPSGEKLSYSVRLTVVPMEDE